MSKKRTPIKQLREQRVALTTATDDLDMIGENLMSIATELKAGEHPTHDPDPELEVFRVENHKLRKHLDWALDAAGKEPNVTCCTTQSGISWHPRAPKKYHVLDCPYRLAREALEDNDGSAKADADKEPGPRTGDGVAIGGNTIIIKNCHVKEQGESPVSERSPREHLKWAVEYIRCHAPSQCCATVIGDEHADDCPYLAACNTLLCDDDTIIVAEQGETPASERSLREHLKWAIQAANRSATSCCQTPEQGSIYPGASPNMHSSMCPYIAAIRALHATETTLTTLEMVEWLAERQTAVLWNNLYGDYRSHSPAEGWGQRGKKDYSTAVAKTYAAVQNIIARASSG